MPLAIEYLPLDALHPRASNPRTHSRKQIQQIADSLKRFGWTNPILIDADNGIIAGHGRWAAARLQGLSEVPVIRHGDLTEAEVRAYVIADNKLAANAGWDEALLRIELGELMAADLDFSIEITGFETPEIDIIMAGDASRAEPEVAQEPADGPTTSREGDLWELGVHRLICGDSLKPETFQALLGDTRAAAVFTDPPYNVRIRDVVGKGRKQHREFAMASGEMTEPEFEAFLQQAFDRIASASSAGAIAFVCMDWRHANTVMTAAAGRLSELKNICVWDKGVGGMGSLYRSRHELVFVYKVGTGSHVNNVELGRHGRNRTNVWSYPGVQTRRGDLALHPTVKPISMVADAIRDVTRRKDVVLDPFLGSGTTLLAAEQTGRRCYGVELDPRYVDLIIRRFEAETGLKARHAVTGELFSERARAAEISEIDPQVGTKPNAAG